MVGLGTILNVLAIIIGGLFGLLFKKAINERVKTSIVAVLGVSVILMASYGVMDAMKKLESDNALLSNGTLIMILCIVLGTLIGEIIQIEKCFEKFGQWLKAKTKNEDDAGFLHAFLTATYTVCIGAMAVIGSINDGMQINGGYTLLLVKAILDGVFILIMTATLGKGCIFSAIPIALIQGSITVLAFFLGDFMTENAKLYLSLVGNVTIFCVGINLLFDRKLSVANMLPSIVLAIVCGFII